MRPPILADQAGLSSRAPARPEDTTEATAPPPVPARIGYPFDPRPHALRDEVRARWLIRVDLEVAAEMIAWGRRRGRLDSCWTVKRTLAASLGVHPRTVQSSWTRLAARGWIERRTFADGVDPDDPMNRTGSRIYFNWAAGRSRPPRDPAELPPGRPRRGRPPGGPAGGGEQFFSPPIGPLAGPPDGPEGEKVISPPPEKFASPNEDPDSKAERITSDDDDGSAFALGEIRETPICTGGFEVEQAPPASPLVARYPGFTTRELAEKLRGRLRDRGIILKRFVDAEGIERINPDRLTSGTEPIRPDEVAELMEVRAEVLALLRGDPNPARPAGPAGPGAVRPEAVAKVRALVKALPRNTDAGASEAAGRAICEAMGDHKPRSVETFRGYAERVRTCRMGPDDLLAAVSRASKPGVRNRGAKLVSAVQELADVEAS